MEIEELSNRERIAYMYAWSLSFDERARLDKFTLLRATATELITAINTEHEHKDFLKLPTGFFHCTYINTSYSHLQDVADKAPHTRFLVSLRCARKHRVWFALITKERDIVPAKEIVVKQFADCVELGQKHIDALVSNDQALNKVEIE